MQVQYWFFTPPQTHTSVGDSWTLTGKFGSVSFESLLLSPGSSCAHGFVFALQESVFPALCKFWHLYGGINGNLLQAGLCHIQVCCTQSPSPCDRPLLTRTSTGYTQTQFLVSAGPLDHGAHKVSLSPPKKPCLWRLWS